MREDWDCILRKAKSGDQRAYEQLLESHRSSIEAFCRRFFPSQDQWCDVAQEALLRAWDKIAQFHGPEPAFKSWLFKVARTHCLNKLRGIKAETSLDEMIDHGVASHLSTSDGALDDALDRIVRDDLVENVKRRIADRIPPWDDLNHAILFLYCVKLMPAVEIAEYLDTNFSTIRSRLLRHVLPLMKEAYSTLEQDARHT